MANFSDLIAYLRQYFPLSPLNSLTIITGTISFYLLYRRALPKPIPGIPYNESSARKFLGDVPAMVSHISQTDGTFVTYLMSTMKSLNAPLIQVFIQPMSKPLLVLADFRETEDLMLRRKDFDRSSDMGDLVKGLVPNHHIQLKTNARWKSQRRLIQDLMTPSFLHAVAGPVIHQNASILIELWRTKSRIANGRPWEAAKDINQVALDAVMSFAFGERFRNSATKASLEVVKGLDEKRVERSGGLDELAEFPPGQIHEVLQAILDLSGTVGEMQGSPLPKLTWAYISRRPRIQKATKIKNEYILNELKHAVQRREAGEGTIERSAVHHMILREKSFAEKEKRNPDYLSGIMIDEIFGFIFAGHETTSTTICWGLKLLADHPEIQTRVRTALQSSYALAKTEGRNPTIQEITGTPIPYLDATMEEMQRFGGTSPIVDREALVDTELLGHHIPKGTNVICLTMGPSMITPAFEIDEGRRTASCRAAKEGKEKAWDPEDMGVFIPERWLKDGEFDGAAGPLLAFGLGTRGCYGRRLAYVEMRIIFTLVLWNFELLQCPPAFSGYKSVLVSTNNPKDCYVRLREVKFNEK